MASGGVITHLYDYYSLCFVDANTGYIGGLIDDNSQINVLVKTTDGGNTWSKRIGTIIAGIYTGISFCNPDTGYMVSSLGQVAYTTNGGANWNSGGNLHVGLTSVKTINADTAFVTGGDNLIARTVNAGLTWDIQTPNNTNIVLFGLSFPNDSTGYAVGEDGTILKTTNGGVIGIGPVSNKIPSSFHVYQNYPNPFNPGTTIKIDISKQSNVKIIIYDVSGKEIAVLVNEQLKAGSYSIKWNAANYPSGLYFVKMITNEFSDTRKMILLK